MDYFGIAWFSLFFGILIGSSLEAAKWRKNAKEKDIRIYSKGRLYSVYSAERKGRSRECRQK